MSSKIKEILNDIEILLSTRSELEDQKQKFWLLVSILRKNKINDQNAILRGLEISRIALEEMSVGINSVIAIVIYNILKNNNIPLSEIEKIFGKEIYDLVDQLRKTNELYTKARVFSSENFQNLLLNIAEDIRVILLIISDRLYYLRNAKYLLNDDEKYNLALEVFHLYAPISHRLGLYKIKGEMEDLSLKYRDRKTFDFIKKKLGETKLKRDAYIKSFIEPVRKKLEEELQVPFSIKGRTKSISSINNKLRKGRSFEDMYDLFAIRIIVDTPYEEERKACWHAFSIVTDMYIANPNRMKDWISIPKSNGYESLHTTVMGPDKKWVEVQIRSKRMDEIAERGVAAHWKYKGIKSQNGIDEFLTNIREMLELLRNETNNYKENPLSPSILSLKSEEIYVFTPKGAVIKLPRGATVLDFAFSIHSKIGASATSAKVNGKNVSIKYQLNNGDVVEILTSNQQKPNNDWLSIVVSPRAKNRIRQILRAEEEAGISVAKETLQRRFKNRKIVLQDAVFVRTVKSKGYKTITDFYIDLNQDKIDLNTFIDLYESNLRLDDNKLQDSNKESNSVKSANTFVANLDLINNVENTSSSGDIIFKEKGMEGVEYSLAKCCRPVFGDKIFAFIASRNIKIHRRDCPNAESMFATSPHRILDADWNGGKGDRYMGSIEVIGRDDIAIVTNIISLISKDSTTSLRAYSIDSADGLFKGTFTIFVENKSQLSSLIKKINSIIGVKSVERL